jgi:hypothetical protein
MNAEVEESANKLIGKKKKKKKDKSGLNEIVASAFMLIAERIIAD